MKDGHYEMEFSAGGYCGRGHAIVAHEKLHGADGDYRFDGTFVDGRAHVTSNLNVTIQPDVACNAHVPGQFSVQLSGTANDDAFSLLGTGPLGLIIGIDGVRVDASRDRH